MLLWNANTTHQMLHAHDIYHIFQIFEQEVDGLVCYYFSTTKENMQIVDWYLNHIDLLKHFIFYFKDKAHDLIEVNDRKKLIETKFASHTLSHTENESIKKFFEETTIKRYYLSGAYKDIYLSKREFDCAHYLMDGYSSKLIARHLNLSPRTVESYINQVKAKLNCRTKNQIIKILLDAKEERYLIHS
jgi:DNA-binding CsgD family transcriptional regulator